MALYLLTSGANNGEIVAAAATRFFPIAGDLEDHAAEADTQNRARSAYTLSDLLVRVINNSVTAASTVRSRVNGANGNQSVSIGASATGVFEDITNTDTIASGDLINSQLVVGSTGTEIELSIVSYTLEDATATTYILVAFGTEPRPRGQTRFMAVGGRTDPFSFEFNNDYNLRVDTTFSNLRIFVSSNGIQDPSTLTFRIAGANGNQSISIGASASGEFEDITNNDVVSANTLIAHQLITGAGQSGDPSLVLEQVQLKGDGVDRPTLRMGSAVGQGDGLIRFVGMEAPNLAEGVESATQLDVRHVYDVRNLFVKGSSNTLNGATTFTLRQNGVDTILSVSIGATASGNFEDITNEVALDATDEINTEIDTTASTAGSITYLGIGYQIGEPPVPPIVLAGPLQDVVGSTTWGIARPLRVLAY